MDVRGMERWDAGKFPGITTFNLEKLTNNLAKVAYVSLEPAFATLMNELDFKIITSNKSRQPKDKVVYGLLYDEMANIEKLLEELGHMGVSQSVVASEAFLDDDIRNTDGILTSKNLKHCLTVGSKMSVFKNFIKDMNAQTERFLAYKMNVFSTNLCFRSGKR